MHGKYDAIYEMVSRIPQGYVATYGQIARLVNRPRSARLIGYALSALTGDNEIPWHRVVNAQGKISPRNQAGYEDYQRIMLEDEGVEFDPDGSIDLNRFSWRQR